jgi:ribosomal protein L11 methyltransferase
LRLDPGLAFGTGTHPTTALCLEWLDALFGSREGIGAPDFENALVVDYGSGSGILAIAALRLGAAEAIAVDIDPQALQATRSNAAINGVDQDLTACMPAELAAVLAGRKADILVANILAGPLQSLLPEFAALLRERGVLALSGILAGQETALEAAAARCFRLDPPARREGWVRLSGQRKSTS